MQDFPHGVTPAAQLRRQLEMQGRGETISLAEVLTQQNQRDAHDARRPVGALRKAADAVEVCTDDLSVEQVLDRLEQLVRQRQGSA